MGYCLGGGLSIWAASVNEKVGAAVSFYGVFPHGKPDMSKIRVPSRAISARPTTSSRSTTRKGLEQELKDAGVDAEFFLYEGCGHAFASEDNRIGTGNEQAKAQAWCRMTDFYRANLG